MTICAIEGIGLVVVPDLEKKRTINPKVFGEDLRNAYEEAVAKNGLVDFIEEGHTTVYSRTKLLARFHRLSQTFGIFEESSKGGHCRFDDRFTGSSFVIRGHKDDAVYGDFLESIRDAVEEHLNALACTFQAVDRNWGWSVEPNYTATAHHCVNLGLKLAQASTTDGKKKKK